ncbi:MAG: XRE family transcriptional regulator [Acidobacteriia bacterium]|nr:XRE family transcriptional regulator [Terriglobia bacterium]
MDEINLRIADRLRRLRRAAGLSLGDLAERAGVSRAMLSQIETEKTNPTIAVLWKVAHGLGVPFSELLGTEEAPPAPRLSPAGKARYLYSADRRYRSRPLLGNVPGHRVELYELRLEAGAVENADPHPKGSFEQVYVNSGRLRMDVGETTHELGPGDAILFPADRPHRYESLGRAAFTGLSLILYGG